MTKARAAICERICIEKEGHRRGGDWWRTSHGVWPVDHGTWDILASSLQWLFDLEGELMLRGWKFGARGGRFVAYRHEDKKLLAARRRDEVIGQAYLETAEFIFARDAYT